MRISKFKKRCRGFYFIILAVLFIFAAACFFSFYYADFLADKVLHRYLKLEDMHLSADRCGFSFKNGIVLKGFSLINKEKEISAKSLAFKKDGESITVKIEGAAGDIHFFQGLMLHEENNALKAVSVEVYLRDIKLKVKNKDFLKIEKGFIFLDRNGINWDLRTKYKLTDVDLKGYASLSNKVCLFSFDVDSLKLFLTGEYDFNTKTINSKLFSRSRTYNLSANLVLEQGNIVLKNIMFEKFLIPGPIDLNVKDGITSEWSVRGAESIFRGDFGFEDKGDTLTFYIRVLKAHLDNYELVTNFYLDYAKAEKTLKFNSRGTVLNNQPFPELSFSTKFLDTGILIENFKYQGGVNLSGYWDYGSTLSCKCRFEKFDIYKLIKLITPLYSRYFDVTSINGEADYSSRQGIKRVKLLLDLSAGRIWDVIFESGRVQLVGDSNMLEFVNSELVVDGDSLKFEGKMDISKFPDADMWRGVFLVPGSSSLLWDKASFEDSFGKRKLSLGAKLKENVKLDYNVEFSDQENYNRNEVSLEIIGKQNFKLRLREDEEIMGVEKKIEF